MIKDYDEKLELEFERSVSLFKQDLSDVLLKTNPEEKLKEINKMKEKMNNYFLAKIETMLTLKVYLQLS